MTAPYGLAAAVWTRDLSRAHKMARKLRAGTVWVDTYDHGDRDRTAGGFKAIGQRARQVAARVG